MNSHSDDYGAGERAAAAAWLDPDHRAPLESATQRDSSGRGILSDRSA